MCTRQKNSIFLEPRVREENRKDGAWSSWKLWDSKVLMEIKTVGKYPIMISFRLYLYRRGLTSFWLEDSVDLEQRVESKGEWQKSAVYLDQCLQKGQWTGDTCEGLKEWFMLYP